MGRYLLQTGDMNVFSTLFGKCLKTLEELESELDLAAILSDPYQRNGSFKFAADGGYGVERSQHMRRS